MKAIELLTASARRWAQGGRRNEPISIVPQPTNSPQLAPQMAPSEVALNPLSREAAGQWSLAQRIAFRFFFVYFIIYSFPFPFSILPGSDKLFGPYNKIAPLVVPWVAKHVLQLSHPMTSTPNGSGDRAYNYVQLFCFLLTSFVATIVWSIFDRRREKYDKLFALLRVYVRYVLACTMLSYGMSKVFKLQFPDLFPNRLLEPYGESSPMGLLWTFMGYSASYTIFSGLAETIGGLLLFFRRTATLGALLLLAVIGNIVMLNFSYDVPVKLYSSNLLIMSVFVLAPDLRRLANVLILNRPTESVLLRSPPRSSWMKYGRLGAKILFVAFVLYTNVTRSIERRKTYAAERSKVPFYGNWEVEEFVKNGAPAMPKTANSKGWRTVSVNNYSWVSVRLEDNSAEYYKIEHDAEKRTITFSQRESKFTLAVDQPDADQLTADGVLKGDSVKIRLRRINASKYLLLSRGFHWINEVPYNR